VKRREALGVVALGMLSAAGTGLMQTDAMPYAAILVVLLAVIKLPVITVRAPLEGGYVVVDGYHWPKPQTRWSCTLAEAEEFGETFGRTPQRVARRRARVNG
jgi:hypothetical protein